MGSASWGRGEAGLLLLFLLLYMFAIITRPKFAPDADDDCDYYYYYYYYYYTATMNSDRSQIIIDYASMQ